MCVNRNNVKSAHDYPLPVVISGAYFLTYINILHFEFCLYLGLQKTLFLRKTGEQYIIL